MALKRVAPEATRCVDLHWSRPAPYTQIIEEGSAHDGYGWLYMILGYYGSSHPKLFYIGKVYKNHVSARLRQADHKRRYENLVSEHPRHSFQVSLGSVEIENGKITKQRIDQIETMLIYTASASHSLVNKNKWLTHRISTAYHVTNHGFHRPLPREIQLGIFTQ